MDLEDRFLRLNAVVEKTGRARASIYRMMKEGTFPRQERIGLRAVGWRLSAIQKWMDAPASFHASDQGPNTPPRESSEDGRYVS